MDYTQASAHVTHPGTGQRMAQDTLPVPTASTAKDFNMVVWSLMELLKEAGISGAQFDPGNPATYTKVRDSIRYMGVPVGAVIPMGVDGIPDGFLAYRGDVEVPKTAAPRLYAKIGDRFKQGGDAADTFRVCPPTTGGHFIRILDQGGGIDTGRAAFSLQTWSPGQHTHPLQVRGSNRDNGDPGPLVLTGPDIVGDNNGTNALHSESKALANSASAQGFPSNLALPHIIKI